MRLPIAALAVAVLAGCGGDTSGGDTSGGGGEVPAPSTRSVPATSAPPPTTIVHVVEPEKCTSPYSTPAPIEASVDVAFKVQSLTLCVTADRARTRLKNESSTLVWTIDQTPRTALEPHV